MIENRQYLFGAAAQFLFVGVWTRGDKLNPTGTKQKKYSPTIGLTTGGRIIITWLSTRGLPGSWNHSTRQPLQETTCGVGELVRPGVGQVFAIQKNHAETTSPSAPLSKTKREKWSRQIAQLEGAVRVCARGPEG